MESIGSCLTVGLLWLLLSSSCGGDENRCDLGESNRCEEQSGPLELQYCQSDGSWSECTREVECNPLTQEGCEEGLACFFTYYWTFCAPAASFPCDPGELWASGVEGIGCQSHCAHDGRDDIIMNAPECDEGEWCEPNASLPEGVGNCGFNQGDG